MTDIGSVKTADVDGAVGCRLRACPGACRRASISHPYLSVGSTVGRCQARFCVGNLGQRGAIAPQPDPFPQIFGYTTSMQ